ncbi:hypothetical protein CFBP5875_04610 [Agrobacterium pusense]|uniref:Lar family restriction alleviation protein n=1 Tax=Agrobacterium pusense TaxID=648995 RepID=UPI0010BEB671|nr:Lar family restriction alleviation protein [Agrobacterium pusense]QCL83900.1 hypothetical protein CFBP5875_04610 [Agrobacterium pusense]
MTDKLKPCPLPWCQGEAAECHNVEAFVRCTKCGASSNTYNFMETAVEEWNTRAQPEAVTNAGDVVLEGAMRALDSHVKQIKRMEKAEADLARAREVIAELVAKFGPMLKEIEARGYRNDFAPQYATIQTARTFMEGK